MSKTNPANVGVGKGGATPIKHGHRTNGYKSPEYKAWLGMKRRCYDPKCKDYPNWGGRGIGVCDEWRTSFVAFLRDMGLKPSPLHTIDRLRSNDDYCPSNCRWATFQQQGAENRRGLVQVVVDGVEYPSLAAACRKFGVSPTVANMRIRAGIPADIAVSFTGRIRARRSHESYLPKAKR